MLIAFSTPLGCRYSVSIIVVWAPGALNTYAEFHGGGEEVNAGSLGDFVATGNAGQVDKGRLDDSLLALGGFDDGLRESRMASVNCCPGGKTGMEPDLKPANAIERVAEPAPSLALTTSSPPNWTPKRGQSLGGSWYL